MLFVDEDGDSLAEGHKKQAHYPNQTYEAQRRQNVASPGLRPKMGLNKTENIGSQLLDQGCQRWRWSRLVFNREKKLNDGRND